MADPLSPQEIQAALDRQSRPIGPSGFTLPPVNIRGNPTPAPPATPPPQEGLFNQAWGAIKRGWANPDVPFEGGPAQAYSEVGGAYRPAGSPPAATRKEEETRGEATKAARAEGVANPFAGGGAGGAAGPAPNMRERAKESLGLSGPEYEEASRDVEREQRGLETQQAYHSRLGYEEGAHMADMQRGLAEQGERNAHEMVASRQRQAVREQEAFTKVDRLAKDFASSKVDPDHIWKEKGTGAHVLSAIGIALGAIGQAIGGGPNTAMQIVQGAIDRDIQAQRDTISAKGQAIEQARGAYGMLRQQGLDDMSALSGARAISWDATARQIQAEQLRMGNEATKRQADDALKYAQLQAAQHKQQMMTAIRAQQYGLEHPKATGAGAAGAAVANIAGVQEKNAETDVAAGDILSQGDDIAGYGVGGRVAHFLSEKTGLPLESNEAKRNRLTADELAAGVLKASGARVTPEAKERILANVHNEADLRALAQRVQRGHAREEQAAAAKGTKKTALDRAEPQGVDDIEDEDNE